MNDEAAVGPLEDRELRNLAGVTGAEPDVINRIMQAAAEAGIAYLLPPLRATGHFRDHGPPRRQASRTSRSPTGCQTDPTQ